jgi:hypothetical protein
MTQLTGTGAIPQPIEGYKLVVHKGAFYIDNVPPSVFIQQAAMMNIDVAGIICEVNKQTNSWQPLELYKPLIIQFRKDCTWQLLPILDSGIWISGEMPLPEPKEGTLLVLAVQFDSITCAVSRNCKWMAYDDEGQLSEIDQLNYNIQHWQWISAPK